MVMSTISNVSCVSRRGKQHRIRKSLKLYIVLQRNALVDIKISIIDICYANTAPIPKTLMVLYFISEKFNKNAKVEKLTKKLGRGVRPIVIGPYEKNPTFHPLLLWKGIFKFTCLELHDLTPYKPKIFWGRSPRPPPPLPIKFSVSKLPCHLCVYVERGLQLCKRPSPTPPPNNKLLCK